ncbi:CIA30 family protein [Polaribacter aestuariivivens]|uniref:CIA30 family protein n=1 Tax=Polaribacter aestuariivivens TaxID=2304626 RepID=A0A5S3N9A0_9FLAO|nr:CIA30 family protein [Polaribacter aestuariivivens]TMM29446.1 CIA30 family protein [Polaribacter aestuariivivens]
MSDSQNIIFDFNLNSNISSWRIVDDVVMGGKSNGNFKINKEGHGMFYGDVSLENNGGFSSLRYRFSSLKVIGFSEVVIRLKGDKKKYQFRIKDKTDNYYSFISTFDTNGEWQTIKISLAEMYPAFRGKKLNMNNFSSDSIEELAFLIGNKKEQSFKLEIDKIYLQ